MKKSVLTIPILMTASVVAFFFGRQYAASQQDEMTAMQIRPEEETVEEVINGDEDTQAPSVLEEYQSRDTLSLYEQLDFLSLTKEDASIAFYGDIDIEEDWFQQLVYSIEENTEGPMEVGDFTHSGLDSYELMIRQTVQSVNDFQPDVLVYGLPALPDKVRDIGLADTDNYMSNVLNQLSANENMKLVLVEPYVKLHEIDQLNSRSLDYRSYLNTMRDLAEERDLTLLPLHSDFSESADDNGLDYYFAESDNELNEAGNELVTEIVDGYFSQVED
ncbi:MAG: SGNH/GDSL hydrolase family protein [Alkalibacterium sp.]|nr:SGNH/GDSL hydrolase family protein [Alkalibacterium sp.]